MSEVAYDIEANLVLKSSGAFQADMGKAASSADMLHTHLGRVEGGAMQMGSSLAGFASAATSALTGMAAGAGVAAIATGAVLANHIGANLEMLENKSIQLATVLAAATAVPFERMKGEAAKLFEDFKQDAVTSAGETQDFVNIAGMLAGPIAGAGKGMADLREITKGVMQMAPGMGVSFEQAGSDVMRMLQGVAGIEQPMFRAMVAIPALGIANAHEFNKLTQDQRYTKTREALNNPAFAAAAKATETSLAGLKSTYEEIKKTSGQILGGPMFEMAKNRLAAFNNAAMASLASGGAGRSTLETAATLLTGRFAQLETQLRRIFPHFQATAEGALHSIVVLVDRVMGGLVSGATFIADHWSGITSAAERFANFVRESVGHAEALVQTLGGGDLAKGIERLAEIGMGGKAAGMLAPIAGGALQLGQGLYGLARGGGSGAMEGAALDAATLAAAGAAGAKAAASEAAHDPFAVGRSVEGQISGAGRRGRLAQSAASEIEGSTWNYSKMEGPSLMERMSSALFGSGAGAGATAAGGAAGAEAGGILATIEAAITGIGAAAGPFVVVAMAVVGAIEILRTNFLGMTSWLGGIWHQIGAATGELGSSLERLWTSAGMLWTALSPVISLMGGPLVLAFGAVGKAVVLLVNVATGIADAIGYAVSAATMAINEVRFIFDGMASALAYVASAATLALNAVKAFASGILEALHVKKPGQEGAYDAPEVYKDDRDYGMSPMFATGNTVGTSPAKTTAAPHKGGGKQQVEVTVKFELGNGNEDAIITLTRKQVEQVLREAKSQTRGGIMAGT